MKIPIQSTADLGLAVRATRRAHRLRLDDAAGSAGVGAVFAGDVEHGKETVQFGRVLRLVHELGITLYADLPESVAAELEAVRRRGIKPRSRRPVRSPDRRTGSS